jgi:hypothetical protein
MSSPAAAPAPDIPQGRAPGPGLARLAGQLPARRFPSGAAAADEQG